MNLGATFIQNGTFRSVQLFSAETIVICITYSPDEAMPLKNAKHVSNRKSRLRFKMDSSKIGRYNIHMHFSRQVVHSRVCCFRCSCACIATRGWSVSGIQNTTMTRPVHTVHKAMTDTQKCPSSNASNGDKANPKANPANSIPKLGARHLGGMTSDKADSAIAVQLINPVLVRRL
jgi:hypothetical protein